MYSHAFIHYFTSFFNQKIDDITSRKLNVPLTTIRSADASGLNTIWSDVWLLAVRPDLNLFLWLLNWIGFSRMLTPSGRRFTHYRCLSSSQHNMHNIIVDNTVCKAGAKACIKEASDEE